MNPDGYKLDTLYVYDHKSRQLNENHEKFARIISHDLKSPLTNIISLAELLEKESKDELSLDTIEYLQ